MYEKAILAMMQKRKEYKRKPNTIGVTSLTFPCERHAVFSLLVPKHFVSMSFDSIMTTWVGTMLHQTQFLPDAKKELELEWSGIVGVVDEYSPSEQKLLEIKITGAIPKGEARNHHIEQTELYYLLLEKNNYPVKSIEILYINPFEHRILSYSVIPRSLQFIEIYALSKKERVMQYAKEKLLPPRNVIPWEEGSRLVCAYCPYISLCFYLEDKYVEEEDYEEVDRESLGSPI